MSKALLDYEERIEEIQVAKIKNGKEDNTTDVTEIKRIMGDYCVQLPQQLDKLKFLHKHKPSCQY